MSGVGFDLGEVGSQAVEARGLDFVPATGGEVRGAVFGQSWVDNPFASGMAWMGRRDREVEAGVSNEDILARFPGLRPDDPMLARRRQRALVPADELNERYPALPGMNKFTRPMPDDVAKEIHEANRLRVLRRGIVERREEGIGTGLVAQFGVGLAASALDPLNVASAFIPVAPQARIAAWLAQAGSATGRAGVRAGVGAAQGAVGAAVLEPLIYARDQSLQNDWDMGNAAMNLAFGAALGGVLNPVIGRFSRQERDFRRPVVSDVAHEAGMREAIQAIVENRPVAAAQVIEAVEARQAREELAAWARQTARLLNETDETVARATPQPVPDWSPVGSRARENLAVLQEQTARLRAEIAEASDRTLRASLDPVTGERLAAIETELAGVMPRARRQTLQQERTMLLEGRQDVPAAQGDLEVARGIAQQRGLQAELARATERERRGAEGLSRTQAMEEAARAVRTEDAAASSRLWDVEGARIASRAEVIESMAQRTLRRYAAGQGAALAPDELNRMAVRAVTGGEAEIRAVIAEIDARAGMPYAVVETPRTGPDYDANLDRVANEAEREGAASAYAENPAARDGDARLAELQERAPDPKTGFEEQLAQAQADAANFETILKAERDAGRLRAGAENEITEAAERAARAESDAKAMDAATACWAVRP